jgi:beta-galactosidase
MNKIPDLLGWNIYPGWYRWGTKENSAASLDAPLRQPQRRLLRERIRRGRQPGQHEQNPSASPKPGGQWHPEEWQAEVHEAAWAAMKARPFVWGTFVWCMFDFAVSTRHEGGQPGLNDKGLVTATARPRRTRSFSTRPTGTTNRWSISPAAVSPSAPTS